MSRFSNPIPHYPQSEDSFKLREWCITYGLDYDKVRSNFSGDFDYKMHELVKNLVN